MWHVIELTHGSNSPKVHAYFFDHILDNNQTHPLEAYSTPRVLSPCFVSNYMTVVHDTFEIYGSMLYVKNQWFFQLYHQKNRPMEMEKKESMSTYLCWRDFIVENARPTIFSIFLQNRNQKKLLYSIIPGPLLFSFLFYKSNLK